MEILYNTYQRLEKVDRVALAAGIEMRNERTMAEPTQNDDGQRKEVVWT